MNKRFRRFTAILLIMAMAVSSSYVFAGTDAEPAEDGQQAITNETEDAVLPDAAEVPDDAVVFDDAVITDDEMAPEELLDPGEAITERPAAAEVDAASEIADEEEGVSLMSDLDQSAVITAATLTYNTTPAPDPEIFNYAGYSDGCSIIKVNVNTSGKLWLAAQASSNNTESAKIYVGKYNANTGVVDYSYTKYAVLSPEDGVVRAIGGLDVVAGGSYCIGIESTQSGTVAVMPYVYSCATRTLPVGKVMVAEGYKTSAAGKLYDSKALFRIKPGKTGFIRVYVKEYGNNKSAGYVTLLNSKKKVISDKLIFNDGTKTYYVAFGVKKGVTYYLSASNFQGTAGEEYCYGIQYKNYAAALRANTVKKKATTLKRKGKYLYAAMPATGTSGSQWYKFKVTKKRATTITIDATYLKSGKTTVTVYRGKKKVGSTTITKGKINTLQVTYSNKKGVAKKGTYYVKVTKSAKANGRYKIRYTK